MIWIIGNSHGIETKYKRSPEWRNIRQLFEWEFTRAVVKKLLPLVDERKITYYPLVPFDHNLYNGERAELANTIDTYINRLGEQSIYLSIHGNNNLYHENFHGVEVHYWNHPGMAQIFQNEIVKQTGWYDRGIIKSPFTVLKKTSMPSILTENGFYSNFKQCKQMLTNDYVYKIALGHANAMQKLSK